MKRVTMAAAVLGILVGLGGGAFADEVDELLAKLEPAKRFADHQPKFAVQKKTLDFEFMDGTKTWPFWVVTDHDRVVAIMPLVGFHGGTWYVQDFRPGQGPTWEEMLKRVPSERWHIDTAVGSELRTDGFIPVKEGEMDASYDWKVTDNTVVLTRKYKGTAKIRKWAHGSKGKSEDIEVNHVFTLSVHPQLGYVVDGRYHVKVKPGRRGYQFCSAATSGRYSVWPGEATCQRVVHTPKGKEGYFGYYTNLGATRTIRDGGVCRDGGFVAFLDEKSGWSPTTTMEGAHAKLTVCTAHTDHDFDTVLPKTEPDEKGMHTIQMRHRLLALPPEVTQYLWKEMTVKPEHVGAKTVMVRFGQPEDFEDQPLPLDGPDRGLPTGGTVVTDEAHSGKRSLLITKTAIPGTAQLALKPNTLYRVTAWLKAEGGATAWIQGKYYQWTPHHNKWLGTHATDKVQAGKGWQKVEMEFTTPKWAPFMQVEFKVEGEGKVWVDDFSFIPVKKVSGKAVAGAEDAAK